MTSAKTDMNSVSVEPLVDMSVAQLIDANLDRAREGLRVVEDWCRFGLNRKDLVVTLKDWRQKLAIHHHYSYKQARSTSTDQGLGLTHPAQDHRPSPSHVIAANCARAQEALRVLEEFARKPDPTLAKTASRIRYDLYELEITILRAHKKSERQQKLNACNLCLITNPQKELKHIVTKALEAGVKMVQFRDKEGTDKEKLSIAKDLAIVCKRFEALFIVNDRIDLALAVDADGIHLGQNDLPTDVARKLIGDEKLIGRSTNCLNQLQIAERDGCDYLGVGPVNLSNSKPELTPTGISFIREATLATKLPWFAIGGINPENIAEIRLAGAHRIAVIKAIMNANDPSQASLEILEGMS